MTATALWKWPSPTRSHASGIDPVRRARFQAVPKAQSQQPRTQDARGATNRANLLFLDAPAHEVPHQRLESYDLVRGAERVAERLVERDVTRCDGGMWNAEHCWRPAGEKLNMLTRTLVGPKAREKGDFYPRDLATESGRRGSSL